MKTFIKIIGALALLVVLGIVAVGYFTRGMTDTADAFFTAVGAKDWPAAKQQLSKGFQKDTTDAELAKFLADSDLDTYADASWTRREVSGARGELEGTVTNAEGGVVPVKLVLVKEGDAWKLHHLSRVDYGFRAESRDGATNATAEGPVMALPDAAIQAALVKQVFADFARSVDAKDMTHFHGTIAKVWQDQYTVEKLDETYAPIFELERDITFASVAALEPAIEPATALDGNGAFDVTAVYPTSPSVVTVVASFIPENGEWKAYGLNFDAKIDEP